MNQIQSTAIQEGIKSTAEAESDMKRIVKMMIWNAEADSEE